MNDNRQALKVYIASSFSLKDKVVAVEKALETSGYNVLCKWWTGLDYIPWERRTLKDYAKDASVEEFYSHPGCANAFKRDFQGVKDADFLVFVADDAIRKYNGANIELGIALGDNKPCFSIGKLENSALYYPVVKCSSIDELLTKIPSFHAQTKTEAQ